MASPREALQEPAHKAEQWYLDWRARRDQMQSDHNADIRMAESTTRQAINAVEAEYHRDMEIIAVSGRESISLVEEHMIEKKNLKIKDLQEQLQENLHRMQRHFDKLLLKHTEEFSDFMMDRIKAAAPYIGDRLSSARRPSPPPVAHSTVPVYARPPLGSNHDSRATEHSRQLHGAQQHQHPVPFRGLEYTPYGAQTRPHRESDYGRYPGPPTGSPRQPSDQSNPVGLDRNRPRWSHQTPYSHPVSNRSIDGMPRAPVVPSQQKILPSTPMSAEPQRATDSANPTSSAAAYPRLQFRNVDEFSTSSMKSKRKSDTQDERLSAQPSPKRTRSVGAHGTNDKTAAKGAGEGSQGNDGAIKSPSSTTRPTKRTISFDEVYQDGDAEYKHIIVMYPQGDSGGNWYILKCDQHGVHFNTNPLHGAAKHLHSSQHNNMSKEHALAIRELGHQVWDCTKELADKNNDAVKKAFENGYKPFNRNQLSKTERRSMGFGDPEPSPGGRAGPDANAQRKKAKPDPTPKAASKEFTGIAYPLDGELYLAYWSKTKLRFAVIILPWGDLLPSTGMQGTLLGTGLLERPPKCYTIDRVTREITGWAEGYEDGGRLVTKREFPVMYFDSLQKGSVGWVRAKDLSRFSFEDSDSASIPYYKEARDRYAAAQPEKFSSYRHMKQYYEARGLPPKLLSDVRDPPPAKPTPEASTMHASGSDAEKRVDGDEQGNEDDNRSPPPGSPAALHGRTRSVDIEMRDASKADDMESDHESEGSDRHDTDEDVDMGNAESRRTSVSNKGSGGEDGQTEGATTDKQRHAPVTTDSDTPRPLVESSGQDKEKEPASAVSESTEDTSAPVKETVDGVRMKSSIDASAVGGPEPSLCTDAGSPKIANPSRTSDGARTTESPAVAALTEAATGQPSAEADEIRVISATGNLESSTPTERKEGTDLGPANGAPPSSDQAAQSATAPRVTVSVAPTSEVSDNSSAMSSPPSPHSPSTTPSPAAAASASGPSSRNPTPTALRPESPTASERWRAVRSESTAEAPSSTAAPQVTYGPSAGPPATSNPKEPAAKGQSVAVASPPPDGRAATTSANSTPAPTKPAGEEVWVFEIAYYEDDLGGKFQKQKDGPFLRMAVMKGAKTCDTTAGQALSIKINPDEITRLQVDPLDDSSVAPCMVTLDLKGDVEGPKKQQLVFDTSNIMGREESPRIHARRFYGWAKRANGEIDYRNNTFNSSRPATGYTRN